LGTKLEYRRIDVRDAELLHSVVEEIANAEGRMDGLVAAAGIQQETPALEYTAKDANLMMEVNVTGAFMTAQAVAKQMIRFGNGGSIVMIASMSGTIANKVSFSGYFIFYFFSLVLSFARRVPLFAALCGVQDYSLSFLSPQHLHSD
jgi:NAD(P)-dependent dehydrogenase (short-subunit alcohol dehydrogenase family)